MQTTNSKFLLLILTISYLTVLLSALRIKSPTYRKATEEGFTGDPKTHFNYEEFFSKSYIKNKTKTDDPSQIKYGGYIIHDEMLKDKRRTLAYRDAFFKNPDVFKDKIVLEIGAGSGVLSMFAAQAGAKHVYAFEFSDFANVTMKNVEDSGLKDKVTIINKRAEEGELPVDKVDIIISEWMDFLLFGENMIDAVIYARDKWLAEDGLILPDRGQIKLAAVHSKRLARSVDFYDHPYNLRMPAIKQMIKSNNIYMRILPKEVVSSVDTIYEFDIYKMSVDDVNFASSYSLDFKKDTQITALASWWFVEFNLPKKAVYSTDPKAGYSIWEHDVMFLETPLKVAKGEKLTGSISVSSTNDIFKRSNLIKTSYHYDGTYGKYDKIQQHVSVATSSLLTE